MYAALAVAPKLVSMGFSPPFRPDAGQSNATPASDPRLQPTPDYGTLGAGSDIPVTGSDPIQRYDRKAPFTKIHFLAVLIGMCAALLTGFIRSSAPARSGFKNLFSPHLRQPATEKDLGQLDDMRPQKQAETLLELAVRNTNGAVEQISARADGWQGKLQWNSQIASLSEAALNSSDRRVRESAVEVELAAYGLTKNPASLDYAVTMAQSANHQQKIWGLWALGLMANRGVKPVVALEVLAGHLSDTDVDSRHWAVEALSLTAQDEAVPLLLKTMHDDSSPLVRERAACAVAVCGLLTPEQRQSAVPQLLIYTDDPKLDAGTHAWAFHALRDITHQSLSDDAAAWRSWYEKQGGSQ